jgi:uncharacterized protein YlxP (DUF503 family)
VILGALELELKIEGSFSLKDKRRVLQSLLDRLRREFHISSAEVGDHELWNRAVIGVAVVSTHSGHAESLLQSVVDACDHNTDIEIVSQRKCVEPF